MVTKTWESKKEELKDEVKEELQTVIQSGSETHQTGNTQSGLLKAEVLGCAGGGERQSIPSKELDTVRST